MENLNPLLPHIASVIENMYEAALPDIQKQIETDLNKKISVTDITRALNNGVQLGLFTLNRKFKVCREFTTKELKKVKQVQDNLIAAKDLHIPGLTLQKQRKQTLLDYVKHQREQRRKRLAKKRKCKVSMLNSDFQSDKELYKFLCQRCKKSLEREEIEKDTSPETSEGGKEGISNAYVTSSDTSADSDDSRKATEKKEEKKSKLLVERNPMETEPPYCDIFT